MGDAFRDSAGGSKVKVYINSTKFNGNSAAAQSAIELAVNAILAGATHKALGFDQITNYSLDDNFIHLKGAADPHQSISERVIGKITLPQGLNLSGNQIADIVDTLKTNPYADEKPKMTGTAPHA